MDDRQRQITRDGVAGIVANVLLAGAKAGIGLAVGSIATSLDGLNNAMDAVSSVVTVIGTRFASKEPDYEHPRGHGRVEHLTTLVLSVLVTYAGIRATLAAISSMGDGTCPSYDLLTVCLLVLGIVVKGAMAWRFSRDGKALGSPVLIATSKDARNDMLLSAGTVTSALVALRTGTSIEPYVGFIIALFVLWSGIGMLREVANDLVGMRVPRDTARAVRDGILGFPDVSAVHDLVIHSYGPGAFVASARIEVPPSMDVARFAFLEREIAEAVESSTGVRIVALGACCAQDSDGEGASPAGSAYDIAESHDGVMQAHGFIENQSGNEARIDIVVGFGENDSASVADAVATDIAEALGYDEVTVTVDREVTDL